MAPDFKTYLATSIISDGNTVTYRTLSRALKIQVNAAKCMLYEFHRKENIKSPGSVYATYLLSGHKKQNLLTVVPSKPQVNVSSSFVNGNGDVPMPSSPPVGPLSSFAAASQETERLEEPTDIPVKSICLCREENLAAIKEQYEQITAIHIYSLSPARLPDVQVLADDGRAVFSDYHAKQDPLIHNKDYGVIQNTHVRRRKGKRPENINLQPTKEESSTAQLATSGAGALRANNFKQDPKKEDTQGVASRPSSRDSSSTTRSVPKPSLKRDGSSLFKAFAKQSNKPKLERKDTDTSADSKKGELDANADEGESEDEALFLDTNTRTSKKRPSDTQREREERQAKLRKMMDEEEDDDKSAVPKVSAATDMDADPPAAKNGEDADAPEGDRQEDNIAWSDSDTEKKKPNKEQQQQEAPRRRRGKRKVMKKKTVKDEEGFLVTREEEAWESFSEEDTQPVKKTSLPAPKQGAPQPKTQSQKGVMPKAAGAATGKKKDIMSFFGKK